MAHWDHKTAIRRRSTKVILVPVFDVTCGAACSIRYEFPILPTYYILVADLDSDGLYTRSGAVYLKAEGRRFLGLVVCITATD